MELYYMPGACSLATHIVLEWIGKPYTTHRLSHDQIKEEAYLKVNPAGAVPTLTVDGWVLTQNAAILNYLADAYPDAGLGGNDPTRRAEINRWLGLVNSDLHPAFKPLFGATAYLDDEGAIEQSKEHARKTLRVLLERIDQQLSEHQWIAGEQRSIADPYLYVTLRWANMMQLDSAGLPGLKRLVEQMEQDAGVIRALESEGLA